MIQRWFERLRAWFIEPLVTEIQVVHAGLYEKIRDLQDALSLQIEVENASLNRKLDDSSKSQRQWSEMTNSQGQFVVMQLTDIIKALKVVDDAPRLTSKVLKAWQAVHYAATKFEKDSQSEPYLDRTKEILLWSRLFLSENQWGDPGEGLLTDLLRLWDALRMQQAAHMR